MHQHLAHQATRFRLDLIKHLHRFEHCHRLADLYTVPLADLQFQQLAVHWCRDGATASRLLLQAFCGGDSVEVGQTVAVLEAMKMFYEIKAETSGLVREVLVQAGSQVAADELLLTVTSES